MGSDRANPGAPKHNGPNGGLQAQAVEQKHWPVPLICHNVVFWPSEFCKIFPQSLGNGISETLDSKIFRMSKPWTPRKLVHIRRSTRAFGTSTIGGAFENFEPGAPWYNVTPLIDYRIFWIVRFLFDLTLKENVFYKTMWMKTEC
jgi:hypothetical protein